MLQFVERSQVFERPRARGLSALSAALVAQSLVTVDDAATAERTARRQGLRLCDVLHRTYGISQYSLARIMAEGANAQLINPLEQPPAPALVRAFGASRCLQTGLLPWRRIGSDTIVLAARPDQFKRHHAALRATFGPIRMAVTTDDQLTGSVTHLFGPELVARAETRVAPTESCRNWNRHLAFLIGLMAMTMIVVGGVTAPRILLAALTIWAIVTLALNTALRAAAAYIGWRSHDSAPARSVIPARLPVITMLVPLYNETAIAEHLLTRLKALDYPRELLDVCLVLEADDLTTRATLGRTTLPTWMRAIVVPAGTLKTKPRALNYALDFAHGSIIGVWDAEDAPAPDQLHTVAHHFAGCDPEVACLQGTLDYYNADANWLTRCFTIEYAGWFRVVLPGLQKLGLVVPLGGTTLFFRRNVLEKLGGWDAHNVTEDADLGVRLARYGYRTELIETVTEEEANGRFWPWGKQRSRWLKGYAITYGVHMRNPAHLWRDLGAWRFFGVQMLFLGTLSQFVLAPVLWTFWLLPFGFDHLLAGMVPRWTFWALAGLFVISEIIGFAAAAVGVTKARKTWLIKWALSLQFYFPMAALAAYKGLYELATKPFYWDKTAHGVLLPKGWKTRATQPLQRPVHPVSGG